MGRTENKGHHEKSMEETKDLIDRGAGASEIRERTGLDNHDIEKAREKMEGNR
jgi:hypothetical protein